MPRIAKREPTSRLNLELTQTTRDRLENLRDATQADSLTEVIRSALAVYEFLHNNVRDGGKIYIRAKNGTEREVVILK